jgi:hypothetical protein
MHHHQESKLLRQSSTAIRRNSFELALLKNSSQDVSMDPGRANKVEANYSVLQEQVHQHNATLGRPYPTPDNVAHVKLPPSFHSLSSSLPYYTPLQTPGLLPSMPMLEGGLINKSVIQAVSKEHAGNQQEKNILGPSRIFTELKPKIAQPAPVMSSGLLLSIEEHNHKQDLQEERLKHQLEISKLKAKYQLEVP